MYLEFFNLREFPFSIGCDERFFYQSDIHSEALANMLYAIGQRKGMVLISGEVGAGKTFLINMLASRLGRTAEVALTFHPPASALELLRSMCECFNLPAAAQADADKLTLVSHLRRYLEDVHRRGKLIALVLDEGQDLGDESLEELRLVWNWERAGQRLVQIVLVGQPELRQRLTQPRFEGLRQRIVLSYHLGRLGRIDTARYIEHRIGVAAGQGCRLRFEPAAYDEVFNVANGVPRLINTLCDDALLTAYARGMYTITGDLVRQVVRDMTILSPGPAVPAPLIDIAPPSFVPSAAPKVRNPPPPAIHLAPPAAGPPAGSDPGSAGSGKGSIGHDTTAQLGPGHVAQPPSAVNRPAPGPITPAFGGNITAEGGCATSFRPEEHCSSNVAGPPTRRTLLEQLESEPSLDMARQIYEIAQQHSPAHHLSVRVMASLLAAQFPTEKH